MDRVWELLKHGPKQPDEISAEIRDDPEGIARMWAIARKARPQIESPAEAEKRFRAQRLGGGIFSILTLD